MIYFWDQMSLENVLAHNNHIIVVKASTVPVQYTLHNNMEQTQSLDFKSSRVDFESMRFILINTVLVAK